MWLLSKCSFLGLNRNGQDCFLAGWLVGRAWLAAAAAAAAAASASAAACLHDSHTETYTHAHGRVV